MLTATTQIQQPQCVYYVERVTPKRKPVYRFAKRAFDLIGAIALLIILAVPMAILAVLIRLVSPGPALFGRNALEKTAFLLLFISSEPCVWMPSGTVRSGRVSMIPAAQSLEKRCAKAEWMSFRSSSTSFAER